MDGPRRLIAGEGEAALFVVVSTGQGVANLPPLLETVRPGDTVLWMETPEAKRAGWTVGPQGALLRACPNVICARLDISDEPRPACEAVDTWLRGAGRAIAGHARILVGNGGTKPLSAALGYRLSVAHNQFSVIYGQDKPAELRVLQGGAAGDLHSFPYQRVQERLTLADILACSGHIVSGNGAVRLWPGAADAPAPPAGYGSDPQATRALHRSHFEHARGKRDRERGYADYDRARDLVSPDRLENWRRRVAQDGARGTAEVARSLFNGAVKISQEAYLAGQRRGEAGAPSDRIGDALERAAARRVKAWLRDNGARLPICEAWANVKAAPASAPGRVIQELDIAFVLTSGVIVAIECKTFDANQKDLDARLHNLLKSGSQLARLVLCAPIYTDFAADDWFVDLDRCISEKLRPYFSFVAFTLPGQPQAYAGPPLENAGSARVCPPFEEALVGLLGLYAPVTG